MNEDGVLSGFEGCCGGLEGSPRLPVAEQGSGAGSRAYFFARIPNTPANWAHAPTQAELKAEIARVLSEWATKKETKGE